MRVNVSLKDIYMCVSEVERHQESEGESEGRRRMVVPIGRQTTSTLATLNLCVRERIEDEKAFYNEVEAPTFTNVLNANTHMQLPTPTYTHIYPLNLPYLVYVRILLLLRPTIGKHRRQHRR